MTGGRGGGGCDWGRVVVCDWGEKGAVTGGRVVVCD